MPSVNSGDQTPSPLQKWHTFLTPEHISRPQGHVFVATLPIHMCLCSQVSSHCLLSSCYFLGSSPILISLLQLIHHPLSSPLRTSSYYLMVSSFVAYKYTHTYKPIHICIHIKNVSSRFYMREKAEYLSFPVCLFCLA